MPSKRRTAARRAAPAIATRQQSTLSFHGKSGAITKAGVTTDAKTNKKDPASGEDVVEDVVVSETDTDIVKSTATEVAIEQQVTPEKVQGPKATTSEDALVDIEHDGKTEDVLGGRAEQSDVGAVGGKRGDGWNGEEEAQARKITDAQIKRYWRNKEAQRLAPRVHQEDLSVYEKALREWDMSGQYGPCIGIARLKRWKRANLLGLNPPIEILSILLKEMDAGDSKSQKAHVDELLSSRFVET